MNKEDFFLKVKDALMIESESVDESTPIQLTSLTILIMIAFIDENFNKQVNIEKLEAVSNIGDLIKLIGPEKL